MPPWPGFAVGASVTSGDGSAGGPAVSDGEGRRVGAEEGTRDGTEDGEADGRGGREADGRAAGEVAGRVGRAAGVGAGGRAEVLVSGEGEGEGLGERDCGCAASGRPPCPGQFSAGRPEPPTTPPSTPTSRVTVRAVTSTPVTIAVTVSTLLLRPLWSTKTAVLVGCGSLTGSDAIEAGLMFGTQYDVWGITNRVIRASCTVPDPDR
ncbi:hypothetical protein Misp03_54430 [Microbispora sp. NBRC 16548]|nr:hypothetical protein Misp03_54430 [Microbispora sp. NBRC 16548]